MPTYEYRCPKGHRFEVFQKMSEEPVSVCPECGGPSERILSGGAGFLFKGDGFYITDYRSESYKKAASKETSGDGSGDGASKPSKPAESPASGTSKASDTTSPSNGSSSKEDT
jgi:putative FmdB family regulatory protein